jgi:predicted transcriptional regulator
MACIAPDGSLTTQAKAVLRAMEAPVSLDEVARSTEIPLYRIRGSVRELVEAGLVESIDSAFRATAAGRSRLEGTPLAGDRRG